MAPELLAQTLGVPLFRTPYFLPSYPEGEWDTWRISHMGAGIDHGYYTRQWVISGMPVLLRRNPDNPDLWETWMSLTPHEIESQEPGCFCARGNTVVMGLGMGWVALNAALNPDVTRVTVVELDQNVIELFGAADMAKQLPPEIGAKIVIVRADALEWRPDEPVDFLYADIWRPIADSAALSDTQRMQENVRAKQVYFWGQELRLYSAFRQRHGQKASLTAAGLKQIATGELHLPLALPWGNDYPARIEAAVENRRSRGLPMEERV